jgi:hypothetical protein
LVGGVRGTGSAACEKTAAWTEEGADKQGRAETFYNYAYPLIFEGNGYVISIAIKEDYNGKRFYDNEFIQEAKLTDGLTAATGPSTRGNLTHPSAIIILRDILNVKRTDKTFKKRNFRLTKYRAAC